MRLRGCEMHVAYPADLGGILLIRYSDELNQECQEQSKYSLNIAVASEKHGQEMLEWKWKGVKMIINRSETLNMWFRSWPEALNILLARAACVDQAPINTTAWKHVLTQHVSAPLPAVHNLTENPCPPLLSPFSSTGSERIWLWINSLGKASCHPQTVYTKEHEVIHCFSVQSGVIKSYKFSNGKVAFMVPMTWNRITARPHHFLNKCLMFCSCAPNATLMKR